MLFFNFPLRMLIFKYQRPTARTAASGYCIPSRCAPRRPAERNSETRDKFCRLRCAGVGDSTRDDSMTRVLRALEALVGFGGSLQELVARFLER